MIAHGDELGRTRQGNNNTYSGDLHNPASILEHPELDRVLDLSRPLGLILNAVPHFPTDADPTALPLTCPRQA